MSNDPSWTDNLFHDYFAIKGVLADLFGGGSNNAQRKPLKHSTKTTIQSKQVLTKSGKVITLTTTTQVVTDNEY